MNGECSFHVVVRREALRSLVMGEGPRGECEFAGRVGRVAGIGVREGSLVEVRGDMGVIRFSVTPGMLPLLGIAAEEEKEVDGR